MNRAAEVPKNVIRPAAISRATSLRRNNRRSSMGAAERNSHQIYIAIEDKPVKAPIKIDGESHPIRFMFPTTSNRASRARADNNAPPKSKLGRS